MANRRVLIMEESGEIRDSLKSILKIKGFEVFTAEKLENALKISREYKPSLCLISEDICIPYPREGIIEIIKELKQINRYIYCVIVGVDDYMGDMKLFEAVIIAGAMGCMDKFYFSKDLDLLLSRWESGIGFLILNFTRLLERDEFKKRYKTLPRILVVGDPEIEEDKNVFIGLMAIHEAMGGKFVMANGFDNNKQAWDYFQQVKPQICIFYVNRDEDFSILLGKIRRENKDVLCVMLVDEETLYLKGAAEKLSIDIYQKKPRSEEEGKVLFSVINEKFIEKIQKT